MFYILKRITSANVLETRGRLDCSTYKRRRGLKRNRRKRNKKKLEKFNEGENRRLSVRLISDEGKGARRDKNRSEEKIRKLRKNEERLRKREE